MNNLVQLSQANFATFPITNTVQAQTDDMHRLPVINQGDGFLQKTNRDGRKFYSCIFPECGKVFQYKSEFLRHKSSHTTYKSIHCPFMSCSKTFKREDALTSHIRTHTGETPYVCREPGCEKKFSSKAGFRYHCKKHNAFLNSLQLKHHEVKQPKKTSTQTRWHAPQEVRVMPTPESRKNEDTLSDELRAPEADFVKKFKLENKMQEDDKINKDLNDEEEFERMVKTLEKENNEIKMKLHKYNKCTGLESKDSIDRNNLAFQTEKQSQNQLPYQGLLEEMSFGILNFDDLENVSNYQF